MKYRVLIALAEPDLRLSISSALRTHYDVYTAEEGLALIETVTTYRPDLILLDQPDACHEIAVQSPATRILVFSSSEASPITIARILDLGADDHMSKPFPLPELEARVRALLRRKAARQSQDEPAVLKSADGRLILDGTRCQVDGQEVHLSRTEQELLRHLLLNEGNVLTLEYLLQAVWGPEYSEEASVRTYIRHLRCKIEADPEHPTLIQTVPGVGYVLRSPPQNKK